MLQLDALMHYYEPREQDPKTMGLYLAVKREDGFIRHGTLAAINFSKLTYSVHLQFSHHSEEQLSDLLQPDQMFVVRGLSPDWILHQPDFRAEIAESTTQGLTNKRKKVCKIRNKHLVQGFTYDALLDMELRLFQPYPWQENEANSLKSIAPPMKQSDSDESHKMVIHDPIQRANFPSVIDLHAHQLVDHPSDYNATEILLIQLKRFDQFLDDAIRLGIDQVFVIHGVGKGKLRDEIFRRLRSHPHVDNFVNEFHPRYKFGATEIHLR